MSDSARTVADAIVAGLDALGVTCVFGLPGSQNVALFEALRRGRLRTIVPTQELAAAFMANGYYRATGRPGVLITIPGPGFTYAITGIAEAAADGAALVWIAATVGADHGRHHRLQELPQAALARPLLKGVLRIDGPTSVREQVRGAFELATRGWPGPVMLEVSSPLFSAPYSGPKLRVGRTAARPTDAGANASLRDRIQSSRHPIIFAGEGSLDGADVVQALAEAAHCPVITTPGARGVIPESHPLALGFDPVRGHVDEVNTLLQRADLVLALGCRFAHSASAGFSLALPEDRLVDVRDEEDAATNYPASLTITAPVALVGEEMVRAARPSGWGSDDIATLRRTLRMVDAAEMPEPSLAGRREPASSFLRSLQSAMPSSAVVVTDSGMHQMLARRYLEVNRPRGLIVPSEFQSMGFGLPAALGAAVATGGPVIALIGDGGLLMTGLEILTAMREAIPITVVVLRDGAYGLIRSQQLQEYGHPHGVTLTLPDLRQLAAAMGARFVAFDAEPGALAMAVSHPGVTLVDVPLRDSWPIRRAALTGIAKTAARSLRVRKLIQAFRALRSPNT